MIFYILPPTYYGHRCQAAISMKARKLTQQYILQPLPKWRYCSWSANIDKKGLALCARHRHIANIRVVVRLLPELKVWEPPKRQGIDPKHAARS